MNPFSEHQIEDLLTPGETPEPPADLAARIQHEIPDVLPPLPDLLPLEPRRQWRFVRGPWQIAAALVFLVGGSFLTLRFFDERRAPSGPTYERLISSTRDEKTAPPTEVAAAPDADFLRLEARTDELVEQRASKLRERPVPPENNPAAQVPAPPRTQAPERQHAPLEKRRSEPLTEEIVVTAQSPVVDVTSAQTGQDIAFDLSNLESSRALAEASTGGTREPNAAPYGDVFFDSAGVNPFIDTEDDRLSTFALDVDTASYSIVRRYLEDGYLPPPAAVRVEELVNYFDYGDAAPEKGDFALHAEGAPSPFGEGKRYQLLRFNLRGREVAAQDRRPAYLTFVVDVSGSMGQENRLGLVQKALGLLVDELQPEDRMALVVYGDRGRVVLDFTGDRGAIRRALADLRPEGSTNVAEGLVLAYELASRQLERGTLNRVILCSDGVANVGDTDAESILDRIRADAARGVELTTVGFGMGNYNDVLMERLANAGNGRYAYVDSLEEAERIFVENLTGTLQTIAAEARVQVTFNPAVVARYRLLGYENRDVADERFRDDRIDAGEIGAGHSVTALYELKLHRPLARGDEVAELRLRYGSIKGGEMVEVARQVTGKDFVRRWEKASPALRLTSLVAEFGEILKGSYWARGGSLEEVFHRAQQVSAEYAGNREVADFVSLAARAADLARRREDAAESQE